MPANLQGIWAHKLKNPWGADFHFDVNVQMNYWRLRCPICRNVIVLCYECWINCGMKAGSWRKALGRKVFAPALPQMGGSVPRPCRVGRVGRIYGEWALGDEPSHGALSFYAGS